MKQQLLQQWIKLSTKLDAMTLRERAMVFVAVTAAILFLIYTMAVEPMLARQKLLLAQIKQQLAAMPRPDPRHQGNPSEAAAREEKRRQLIEMLAEIERRVNEENARPKKRYLSPATREATLSLIHI